MWDSQESCPGVPSSTNMWSYLVRFLGCIWVWTRVFTLFVSISFHAFLEKLELRPSSTPSHTNQTATVYTAPEEKLQMVCKIHTVYIFKAI